MASVKVSSTFIGTPEEMEKYAGQVPAEFADREGKMSEAERRSFYGVITVGTEMEVSEKRAEALLEMGVIEGEQKPKAAKARGFKVTDKTGQPTEPAETETDPNDPTGAGKATAPGQKVSAEKKAGNEVRQTAKKAAQAEKKAAKPKK